jgi:hypothetical protein
MCAMPGAVFLVGDERVLVAVRVEVKPGRGAVARRRAGHRRSQGTAALAEGREAGYLDGPSPGAVLLVGDERLVMVLRAGVVPGGGAVARRRAGHLVHPENRE